MRLRVRVCKTIVDYLFAVRHGAKPGLRSATATWLARDASGLPRQVRSAEATVGDPEGVREPENARRAGERDRTP